MVLVFQIILIVVLLFIISFWKTLTKIRKFRKFDGMIPSLPLNPIFGNASTFLNKTTEEAIQIFLKLAEEARSRGQKVMMYRIIGKLYVWPLDGKSVSKIVESTTELNKSDDYNFLDDWIGGGVLMEGAGNRWKTHRKMLTPTFHFAKLEGYLEVFNAESKIMIECLDEFAKSGKTLDMFPFFKKCTLDTICQTAMGVKIDAQQGNEHPYITAVEETLRLYMLNMLNPHHQIPFIYRALGLQKQKDVHTKTLKKFTADIIAERRAELASGTAEQERTKRNMSFLDILLSNKESQILTEEDIRQEVDTFIFAGHDTTTTSACWACWNLAHNPDIQYKVYEEIVSVFGEDPSVNVTTEGISKLELFERVLKESKRILPPVPCLLRTLTNDMEIGGLSIPAGATVTIPPLLLHSNPDVYPNPEKFDPDRFLPEEIAKRHPYDYIPFSAGLRNCIGQKFAQLNEKVMMIHILINFKIEPMGGFHSTKQMFEAVARPSNGIQVKLTRRQLAF